MEKTVKRSAYAVIALAVVFIVLFSIAPAINYVANPEVAGYSLDEKDGGRSFVYFISDITNDYTGFGTYGVLTIGLFVLAVMSVKKLRGQAVNEKVYNAILAVALFWMFLMSFSAIFSMSVSLDVQLDRDNYSALEKAQYSSYYRGSIAIYCLQCVSVAAIFFLSGFNKTVSEFFKSLGGKKVEKTDAAAVVAEEVEEKQEVIVEDVVIEEK